jgi:hypothetical protein
MVVVVVEVVVVEVEVVEVVVVVVGAVVDVVVAVALQAVAISDSATAAIIMRDMRHLRRMAWLGVASSAVMGALTASQGPFRQGACGSRQGACGSYIETI